MVSIGSLPNAVALCLVSTLAACTSDDCVELLQFRDQAELTRIEPLPHGYVLDAFGRLVAYELDDTPRFEIAGHDLVFRTTDDGRVLVARADDMGLQVDAWSSTGEALGELARIDGVPAELGRPHVVMWPDGRMHAWGGDFRDWWEASSDDGMTTSDVTGVEDMRVLDDGRSYVLTRTILDEMGIETRDELSLRDVAGQTQWTVMLGEGPALERPALELVTVVDDQLVLRLLEGTGTEDVAVACETRWYDTAGTLVRSIPSTYVPQYESPPRPLRLPDGSLVEVDKSRAELGVRVLDEDGDVRCEHGVEADEAFGVSDLAFVDDVLLVVTVDRITHLRLNLPD